jgi:hypothetical protein
MLGTCPECRFHLSIRTQARTRAPEIDRLSGRDVRRTRALPVAMSVRIAPSMSEMTPKNDTRPFLEAGIG